MYSRVGGSDRGVPGCGDPGPRGGLPRVDDLPRGLLRSQGRAPLRNRQKAARGHPAQAKADQADRPGEARQGRATTSTRYRPLVSEAGRQQAESWTTRSPPRTRRGRRSKPPRPRRRRRRSTSSYTRVTAPISGMVGTTLVKPGNLVGRGQNTLLTTISQIDPMLFRVGVTEADYLRCRQTRAVARPARLRALQGFS